jgi:ApbE superfamily uncharacterized protein (UPF0280 family)
VSTGARAVLLPGGRRLHLQHGPIDLIIEAFGAAAQVQAAYVQAADVFAPLLEGLVAELPALRQAVTMPAAAVTGPVAQRMLTAVAPHLPAFITPMAAVAGAVADHVLHAMLEGRRLTRAYVNNGGDIALYLAPGARFTAGIIGEVAAPAIVATATIDHASDVRGIATSGQGGRSFSLGIADAVTVLARDAATADAAATLIANAVNIDSPAVRRVPARMIDPDSDLGERPVTVGVGPLSPAEVAAALASGVAAAEAMHARGLITAAFLSLRGESRCVGGANVRELPHRDMPPPTTARPINQEVALK